ncbi:MFS transporter [Ktedonosporobacter rubrisoli]|uniref:MFS transporter n=2 Tax=Ktedonosporobacter rubrisoli TaxID=2509675 RepID=A0A4P6K4W6_KTERU|nr:MFS transporter [Ktedonosporobacter rubrisoli]
MLKHVTSDIDATRPPARIFPGWLVVAGTFVVSLLGFGVAYTFSSFLPPLQQAFAATRGDVSLVFALSGFLYFCLGAISGPLADRLGPRWLAVGGMLCIGLGMLLTSQAQALWQVYVSYGLSVGLGVGFSYTPAIAAVQRWFVQKRGFAAGMAAAGIGIGTLIIPPLATWLIGTTGWRTTYIILGIITLLLGPVAALLLEHSPQRRGLLPDGASLSSERDTNAQQDGPTLGQALRSRTFWLLYISTFAAGLAAFTPFAHLAAYAHDHGLSAAFGATLIALIGVGSTAGRFLLGKAADRLGLRYSLMVMYFGMMVMFFWWLLAVNTWTLVVLALLFGVFYGGFAALAPALTAVYFNGRRFSSIIGVQFTGVGIGTLLGPSLAGLVYDLSHSYMVPILVSAAACLIATLCLFFIGNPSQPK